MYKFEGATLWALFHVTNFYNIKKLQVFGDSRMVIDWINGKLEVASPHLEAIIDEIKNEKSKLEWFEEKHIYRELNSLVDQLSKEALRL
jgi:ribonuclease HI